MIPILIPAAGASSRMRGKDKLLEPVSGMPLLRAQIAKARSVSGHVLVGLPPFPHRRYAITEAAGVTAVEVKDAADGIGATLRTLFAAMPRNATHAMILLADLPDIAAADLRKVMDAVTSHPDALAWRGATEDGKGGHPIVVAKALIPEFATLTGDDGGKAILKKAQDKLYSVPLPGRRALLDLDTPEDWAAWRADR